MSEQRTKHSMLSWESVSAICCFAGGIGAALLGSVFTAATWIWGAATHPGLRATGTVLLILTIPLLILSGYFLDWAERDKNRASTQKSRNRG